MTPQKHGSSIDWAEPFFDVSFIEACKIAGLFHAESM